MREVEVAHTHLYPGAHVRLCPPGAAAGPVIVVFADGNRVPGRLEGDWLTVEAHRTAAGTATRRKTWPVAPERDGLRVTGRAVG